MAKHLNDKGKKKKKSKEPFGGSKAPPFKKGQKKKR